MCSLYPNIQPFEFENPHFASVSIPEIGRRFFFISDLCHTGPVAFSNDESTDADVSSTSFSETNNSHGGNNL